MAQVSLWLFVAAIVVCMGYTYADPIRVDLIPSDEIRSVQVRSVNSLQRLEGDNIFLFLLRTILAIPAGILGLITGILSSLGISTWPVISFVYDVLEDIIAWINTI